MLRSRVFDEYSSVVLKIVIKSYDREKMSFLLSQNWSSSTETFSVRDYQVGLVGTKTFEKVKPKSTEDENHKNLWLSPIGCPL